MDGAAARWRARPGGPRAGAGSPPTQSGDANQREAGIIRIDAGPDDRGMTLLQVIALLEALLVVPITGLWVRKFILTNRPY